MSLETRSNSALIKRAEQLKRWQDSETFRELGEPRSKNRRIGFSDGCVFLAACAAGDREEVKQHCRKVEDFDCSRCEQFVALENKPFAKTCLEAKSYAILGNLLKI